MKSIDDYSSMHDGGNISFHETKAGVYSGVATFKIGLETIVG